MNRTGTALAIRLNQIRVNPANPFDPWSFVLRNLTAIGRIDHG